MLSRFPDRRDNRGCQTAPVGASHGWSVGCLAEVSEDFVVGAVLLHNEDHVADASGNAPGAPA